VFEEGDITGDFKKGPQYGRVGPVAAAAVVRLAPTLKDAGATTQRKLSHLKEDPAPSSTDLGALPPSQARPTATFPASLPTGYSSSTVAALAASEPAAVSFPLQVAQAMQSMPRTPLTINSITKRSVNAQGQVYVCSSLPVSSFTLI